MDKPKPIDPSVVGESALSYFKNDEVARDSWVKKYALKDKLGNIYEKTPTDMHWRIANELHRIDKNFQKENPKAKVYSAKFYFDLLDRFKFIVPQGSPMFGIGNNLQVVSLSNCFVLSYDEGHPDSYGTIMKVDESLANLMKRRAGCIEENSLIYVKDKGLTPIKDVNIGDYVLSLNDVTLENEFKPVTDKFLADVDINEQVKITYTDGSVLRTSSKHPITTLSEGVIKYKSVKDGLGITDIGFKVNQDGLNQSQIDIYKIEYETSEKLVYWDINVQDNHNYFAGVEKCDLVNIHNCGTDLSYIRPNESPVNNSAITSTGVVPFMERYSNTTREVGQCIEENEQVLTKNGLRKIKDVNIGEQVWTKIGWVDVTNKFKNNKKVYKVTTKFGYEIQTSLDHVFSVYGENGIDERKLKDIKPGDHVNLLAGTKDLNLDYYKFPEFNYKRSDYNDSNRMVEVDIPEYLDEKLAWVLGLMYGDGHVIKHSITNNKSGIGCSFSSKEKDLEISEKYVNSMLDIFGGNINIKKKESKGNWFNLHVYNTHLVEFLNANGLLKQNSVDQDFPELIKRSPISVQLAFISGYFDADGYASGRKRGYVISSVNKNFLQEIKNILMSVGIISNTHYEDRSDKKNWRDIYTLCIVGKYSQGLFVDNMLESLKVQGIKYVAKRDSILTSYRAKDIGIKYNKYSYIPDNTQNISTGGYSRLLNEGVVLENPGILIKDEVVSITEVDDAVTYDLELDKEHLFWCNGFYVHNSNRRGALMLSINISHPDAESFIDAKMEQNKVTGANISVKITDDFMEVVKRTTEGDIKRYDELVSKEESLSSDEKKELRKLKKNILYTQYFNYADGSKLEIPIVAKKLWDKIIHNAWSSAEPGILFWDQIQRESLGQCYEHYGFGNISTNPCVTGDTMVALADGRGHLPIRQLAEEGVDVPVYSVNPETGKVEIKTGRNPRLTKENADVLKITLDDGSSIKTTLNHKFLLKDGTKIEAKDLKAGDSLMRFTKRAEILSKKNNKLYYRINTNAKDSTVDRIFEHRLIAKFNNPDLWESKYDENKKSGWISGGLVIHHKDYNGLNNSPDNLEIMTFRDHNKYHADHDSVGEKNGRYSGITNETIKEHAITLTKLLKRKFSKKDWMKYAKTKNIPQYLSKFRKETLYGGLSGLSKWASEECGYGEYNNLDPRVVKTYQKALKQGYNAEIIDGVTYIEKKCECCGKSITLDYFKREVSYCSLTCSNKNTWKDSKSSENRKLGREKYLNELREDTKEQQLKIYSQLKFKLNRKPKAKEWEEECKNNNIPFRLGKHSPFKTYRELTECGNMYNHKVVSVESCGKEDVYNITVDDNHTLAYVTKTKSKNGVDVTGYTGIFTAQCGEIPLPSGDSCRLIASNLYSYVKNPFTPEAYFDFELFKEHAHHITRIMDNIVEMELEKIDQILAKLDTDPEPEDVKRNEREMWELIKRMCEFGRRTGIGVTAVGDMLASLGLTYGTPEATNFAESVHKAYAIECMRASVDLAEERGQFPIFDWEREKDNPFINRIKEADPALIDRMSKVGRRNIALMTIAPTGTVSIVTQTSSGIEPAFLISYKRRRKIDPNSKDAKVDFVDSIGDKWQEYRVFHHKFIDWFFYNQERIYSKFEKLNGTQIYDDIDECFKFMSTIWDNEPSEFIDEIIAMSPYHKALANDVDWVEKVRMQGAVQKWVDHSISVTVNLPNHVDEALVNQVYLTAHESGCKGCTIYRDGSRSGVLISDKSEKDKLKEEIFKENHAPKRPKKLECDVIPFANKGEKWISFVGLLNDRPYEIFTGRYKDDINIPGSVDKGFITKTKTDGVSSYIFHYEDKDGNNVETINLKTIFDDKFNDNARMLSAMLRHGMPINYTIALLNDLNLDGDLINSWKSGVKRILKRYLKSEQEVKGKKCSNCGSTNIAMVEGCETCQDCGSSKCN